MMPMAGKVIQKMIHYFGNNIYQINLCLKVYGFAKASEESQSLSAQAQAIVVYSAILHDIGIPDSIKKTVHKGMFARERRR